MLCPVAGKMIIQIKFLPKDLMKIRRRNAVHQKVYVHNGHRFTSAYFNLVNFCAYCKVIFKSQMFAPYFTDINTFAESIMGTGGGKRSALYKL